MAAVWSGLLLLNLEQPVLLVEGDARSLPLADEETQRDEGDEGNPEEVEHEERGDHSLG